MEPLIATRRRDLVAFALLAGAVIAVYANSLTNGFALDDNWIINFSDRAHDPWDWSGIWLTSYWPRGDAGAYRPFIIFWFALQWAAGDGATWVFHAVSIALHAATTALLFVLLRRLTGFAPALAGALLFAVHPVHVEAVANVVGQAELLSTAATLAACLIHLGRPSTGPLPAGRVAAITGLYAAALLTKESAIILPALLVVTDAAAGRPGRTREALVEYVRGLLPLVGATAAVVVGVFLLRLHVLGEFFGSLPSPDLTFLREPAIRLPTALSAWVEYARLMVFPLELVPDYGPQRLGPQTTLSPLVLGGALIFGLMVYGASRIVARPGVGFPCAWFLVAILPVSNLLFPAGIIVAERTLYMPSIAVAAALAYAWRSLSAGRAPAAGNADAAPHSARRRIAVAVLGIVCLLFGLRTVLGNGVWRDNESLADSMMTRHPEVYRSHWIAAAHAIEAGDSAAADGHWAEAYRLWPGSVRMNLEYAAWALSRRNVVDAIRLAEDARGTFPEHYRSYQILAHAYYMVGQPRAAIEAANQAIRLGGRNALMYEILGRGQQRLNAPALSALAWRNAARLVDPANWKVWVDYSAAEARNAELDSSAVALDSAFTRASAASAIPDACRYGMTLAPAAGPEWSGILRRNCNLHGDSGRPSATTVARRQRSSC